ncbi:hypothetical protein RM545_00600 [Zunongwangia sp. F260]|uniref:Lipoprotein n=1 Tax=Autumnicola lenta TaxID=3075593 RepID=A0ABU3CFQ0_9FLAO|nr:hypothetical protein [Zunongwangia sp. F260]MDT0645173.1 hypothetical protein [Zunongwangia sp. F260]
MKKLFTFLFVGAMITSCSNDEINEINEPETAVDLETQVSEGLYDNSNLGIYKGLFTTADGKNRATVLIELDGKNNPVASFNFPDGNFEAFRAQNNVDKSQAGSLRFEGENFSFDFNVDADGADPVVSDVTYMGQKGDVMILKETSKAPVQTKTGTYTCESGCFGDDDDTVPHPELGAPGALQTFNFMLQGTEGDSPIFMQYVLNSRTYTGDVLQASCDAGIFGNLITCELFAEPNLRGNTGPIRFRSLDNPDTSLLFHEYASDGTGIACSSYYGTGIYRSSLFGRSTISIITDDAVADGGDCNERR